MAGHNKPIKTLSIGRKNNCDIIIADKNISREHAILDIYADGTCTITDKDSTNRTMVNNRPLKPNTPYYLNHDDQVSIAGFHDLPWKKHLPDTINQTHRMSKRFTAPMGKNVGFKYPTGHISHRKNKESNKKGTILQRGTLSEFLSKLIPIPGLIDNISLFINLQSKSITKMLALIEQDDKKAEAHPFSFLGFAVLAYAGCIALSSFILKQNGDNEVNFVLGSFSIEMHTNYPIMTAFYFALITFIYSWVSYNIFKLVSKRPDSFLSFLKLISLSQGVVLIHLGFFIIFFILLCSSIMMEGEGRALFFSLVSLVSLIFVFYFAVVNIRVNRRFWKISWLKFIPLFILVSFLTSLVSNLINITLELITTGNPGF